MNDTLIIQLRQGLRLGFAVSILLSPVVYSADAIDHPKLQELERPAYLPAKPTNPFQLPPVPPTATESLISGDETFAVNRIIFRGNAAISSSELDSIATPYAGRRLNEADLEELRQKLTRYYIDHGYANSGALLRDDAVIGDTLTFDIVEGRLKSIRLRGLERLDESYITGRLVKDGDAAFNLDTLRERFQLLLDDPLFERMNARLIPDTRLGEAILDVDVERARPYQLSIFANNYRPPSVGANAYGFSGSVRNLTGYGDFLQANLQDALPDGGSLRGSLGWNMPLNQQGTQLSVQLDHGRSSVIEQPTKVLDIRSVLDSKDIGLSQTFIETLQHKLTFGLNHAVRENRTTLLGAPFSFTPGEPNGVTRIQSWRFWQEYSYRAESQVLALRSTFTSARNNLQELSGLPAGSAVQPANQYGLWLGQVQYARQVLDNGAQLVLRGNMQRTQHLLLPLDRMSIGGVTTVRGYRENQMIRDSGSVVNVEFSYPVVRNSGMALNLDLIPFYDYGRGKNRNDAIETLSSAGLSTRLRWQGFSLDLAIAKRLKHPDFVTSSGGTLQDKGIHLQGSYNFF